MTVGTTPEDVVKQLEQIDSCTVSNAIERFQVRLRNEGFADSSVRCLFPQFGPKIGYAVTARIRTNGAPVTGRWYYDRIDWWAYVQAAPGPRFLVIQDVDDEPGFGALFGEIHANIAVALGCVAHLTNGAVRDLPGIQASGLQVFAGNVAVSHAYAHIIDFGEPVEIGGLQIYPGDLLHGDRHGIVAVPASIAPEIPDMAAKLIAEERELLALCRSRDFSFDKLTAQIEAASIRSGQPDRDPK
ncbi:MAG TPA: RraA family protein [Bryobacteraceae bacterium]|nr:RraA family protein [Bryobacteraceae bacterium]